MTFIVSKQQKHETYIVHCVDSETPGNDDVYLNIMGYTCLYVVYHHDTGVVAVWCCVCVIVFGGDATICRVHFIFSLPGIVYFLRTAMACESMIVHIYMYIYICIWV